MTVTLLVIKTSGTYVSCRLYLQTNGVEIAWDAGGRAAVVATDGADADADADAAPTDGAAPAAAPAPLVFHYDPDARTPLRLRAAPFQDAAVVARFGARYVRSFVRSLVRSFVRSRARFVVVEVLRRGDAMTTGGF